jgi:3-isopropylmalate/(R)-2-methylmalate dehydratase large subunit
MPDGQTLIDKIWNAHEIARSGNGQSLLYIDRHLIHDGTSQAFEKLDAEHRSVRSPEKTFGTADHYVPTKDGLEGLNDPARRHMVLRLKQDADRHGITSYGFGDPRQGIVHVIGPELGLTLPGFVLVCGDSHTSTHGALGAFAFGVGASEVAHVLATQTLWQSRPKSMRINVFGSLGLGITAKDLILHIIGKIGAAGANGHIIEYGGPVIEALSIEGRLTVCNMSIEAGARAGLIAPDETTFAYLKGRPFAPKRALWDQAVAYWRTLKSDGDAVFDREVSIDASDVAPTVSWGTSPEDVAPVTAVVPDPAQQTASDRKTRITGALAYMGLRPGTPLSQIAVDRVFIGSCTNGRIEDLRAAAAILKDRKVAVPTIAVPGSASVKAAAEAEGLDRILISAGVEWRTPGCSMCVAMNGVDMVAPGERCASTSNRNFPGRQGRGARTHLMSPAMAAAAAVTGRITDVRQLLPSERA